MRYYNPARKVALLKIQPDYDIIKMGNEVGMRYSAASKLVFGLLLFAGLLMVAFAVLGVFNIIR